ncbi:MAG: Fur family transcriptional regulator [Phycisphaerales bacterium JB060]
MADLSPNRTQSSESPTIRITEPLCAVFRRQLKAEGQKYTPERAQVLDAIIQLDRIFEAEQVIDELRRRGHRVSKATVYRTIHLLQEAGILQRVLTEGDQAQYQLAYGESPSDTLVRLDTREVVSIDVPELAAIRDRICKELGLSPQGHKLQIFAVAPGAEGNDE